MLVILRSRLWRKAKAAVAVLGGAQASAEQWARLHAGLNAKAPQRVEASLPLAWSIQAKPAAPPTPAIRPTPTFTPLEPLPEPTRVAATVAMGWPVRRRIDRAAELGWPIATRVAATAALSWPVSQRIDQVAALTWAVVDLWDLNREFFLSEIDEDLPLALPA